MSSVYHNFIRRKEREIERKESEIDRLERVAGLARSICFGNDWKSLEDNVFRRWHNGRLGNGDDRTRASVYSHKNDPVYAKLLKVMQDSPKYCNLICGGEFEVGVRKLQSQIEGRTMKEERYNELLRMSEEEIGKGIVKSEGIKKIAPLGLL